MATALADMEAGTTRTIDPDAWVLSNLGDLCRLAAERFPERLAIKTYRDGTVRVMTYGELEGRVARFAGALSGEGLKPRQRVAIGIGNRAEFIEATLGALRAGLVPVLLNTRLAEDGLRHIVTDAGVAAVVCDAGSARTMAGVLGDGVVRIAVDGVAGWLDYEAMLVAADPLARSALVGPGDVALQPYTSGSTGKPKGVLLAHGAQIWFSKMHARYMRDVVSAPVPTGLLVVPMFHKNAWVGIIKPMLLLGGHIVIVDQFEARQALTIIASDRVSYMAGVAALYGLMLKERDLVETLDWSSFEAFFCGAAPAHKEMLEQVEREFGCRAYHVYGLTEGGPGVMTHPASAPRGPLASCGKPNSPETEVRLIDAEGHESATFGELHVRSPGLALGYHGLPALTAERFIDGWLRTGDLMSRDAEGWFYFEGRTDDMFNCGGENIYPMEVERLLMAHPAVNLVSVVPIAHPLKGQVPAAMVQLKAGMIATAAELKAFMLANGPAYSHPRLIEIADALPLAATDKIDRKVVAQTLSARAEVGREVA